MRWTRSTAKQTIIFEDSPVGIQCANATGCTVIEVTDVEHTIQEMKKL
jgi:beta-phosphoglucomutase-like phosphatase (HAD superfamily)